MLKNLRMGGGLQTLPRGRMKGDELSVRVDGYVARENEAQPFYPPCYKGSTLTCQHSSRNCLLVYLILSNQHFM